MGKVGYRTSVTFKLQFLTLAIYQWQRLGLSKSATMKKNVKNRKRVFHIFLEQNRNRTEILNTDFKNAISGIFNFTVGIVRSKICTTARTKEFWTENLDLVPNSAHDRQSEPVRRLVRDTDFGLLGIFGPLTDRTNADGRSGRSCCREQSIIGRIVRPFTVHMTFCRFLSDFSLV